MNRKLVLALSLFVLLCSLLYARFNSVEVKSSNGYPVAPDFILTDIDGNEFTLSLYRGKVVLLDFFATWCTPSVNQFYHLMNLHEEFGEKLVLISISHENETILRDFREAYSINWTIAEDISDVFDMYNVSYTPTLVTIDQHGYIRYTHIGLTEESLLRPEIESLLPKTIYVDDDNVAGPWNGTEEHPYQNITSGLEHALDNDTVFVQNGTYYENVAVNKTLSLVGENRNTTIIDGNETGDVVTIIRDNINVSGFTIQKSGDYPNAGIHVKSVSNCKLTKNKVTDNHYGIILFSSNDSNIYGNNITSNGIGIWLYYSSNSNSVIGNYITENGWYGVMLDFSSNNGISGNDIANNYHGIWLGDSLNNSIFENNVSNRGVGIDMNSSSSNNVVGNDIIGNGWYGISLRYSSNNRIYHNNLKDNSPQARSEDSTNVWDDGYPSGGNYWSDYDGQDLDGDGIGDKPYVVQWLGDQDNYPLMGMFSDFNATSEYNVQTICNSTISDFQFNGTAISFDVSGDNGTAGFCRVCIPKALINETYHIFVNGTEISYTPLTDMSNGTHNYLYFNYSHSTQEVVIIPEFPSLLILSLFMIATLLAIIVYKRKHAR